MDNTIPAQDVERVLRDFDRRKKDDYIESQAAAAMSTASAIGSETPLTVLCDIRQTLVEISGHLKNNTELLTESIRVNRNDHRESIAYIQQVADAVKNIPIASAPLSPSGLSLPIRSHSITTPSTQRHFYKGDEIKQADSLVGCIFIHLDAMIQKSMAQETSSDTTLMELRDWAAVVRILKGVESTVTDVQDKISLPSLNSTECKFAVSIVASDVSGRTVLCKPEHINELTLSCPALMGCVEAIRSRMIKCLGIISQARTKRLSYIKYPYVTPDGTLCTTDIDAKLSLSSFAFNEVKRMKEPQKKRYVALVLRDQKKPYIAARTALKED